MNSQEVADHFDVPVDTVRRWVRERKLFALRYGRVMVFDRADVDAFTPPPRGRPKGGQAPEGNRDAKRPHRG